MLPLCHPSPMFMPRNSGMMDVPPMMVPMVPAVAPPAICSPSNINMCPSITMTNEYDSHLYGRFQHVERDYSQYRHVPFNWYRPPKQRYNVVHEDAAVLTLDGPIPIGDFYRYYIYGEGMDDSDEYDEPSYEQRSIGYQQQSQFEPDFDDDDEERNYSQPMRSYSSYRQPTIPPARNTRPSAYSENRSTPADDDF